MSIADIVNAWFTDRLATGAIARNTEAYNQASAALPDLIAQLSATPAPTVAKAAKLAAAAQAAQASDAALAAAAAAAETA